MEKLFRSKQLNTFMLIKQTGISSGKATTSSTNAGGSNLQKNITTFMVMIMLLFCQQKSEAATFPLSAGTTTKTGDGLQIKVTSISGGTATVESCTSIGQITTTDCKINNVTSPAFSRWFGTWEVTGGPLTSIKGTATFLFSEYHAGVAPNGAYYVMMYRKHGSAPGTTWNIVGSSPSVNIADSTVSFTFSITLNGSADFTLGTTGSSLSPLPVTFTSFSGKLDGQNVNLLWETSNEINNHHFEIQRSSDAKNWMTTASVKGSGTSNSIVNYSYSDNLSDMKKSLLYYRLKQVDDNGKSEFSVVIAVNAAVKSKARAGFNASNLPTVYPTVATTAINLNIPADATITIVNSAGISINLSTWPTCKIDVSGYQSGFYFVTVVSPTEGVSTAKFLKQ